MLIFAACKYREMSDIELKESIIQAIQRLTYDQQLKLLEFINAMGQRAPGGKEPSKLLKFAGLFEEESLREIEHSIADCEQIDEDEW